MACTSASVRATIRAPARRGFLLRCAVRSLSTTAPTRAPPGTRPYTPSRLTPSYSKASRTPSIRSFTTSPGHREITSHYDYFPITLPRGPPPQGPFNIDLRALRKEFLERQADAHPDKAGGGADGKRRAEALSARLNEAYRALSDPLSRAQHILLLNGVDTEDETAKMDDPELLMEVMEARETVENADSQGEIDGARAENEERVKESVTALESCLEQANWEDASREAVRLRYWLNIDQACRDWEPGRPIVLNH